VFVVHYSVQVLTAPEGTKKRLYLITRKPEDYGKGTFLKARQGNHKKLFQA